jgi:hypothetical protein
MSLHRLIYCSRPASPSRADLEAILGACRRHNPQAQLTGMLLFTSDCYLQLLEGGRGAVNACFQKICRDARHAQVEIVSYGPVDFRLFDRWSMHYVAQDGPSACDLGRFTVNDRFDPYAMTASSAEQLCLHLSLHAHQAA